MENNIINDVINGLFNTLNPNTAASIKLHKKDSTHLVRPMTTLDIMRMRILPKKKLPDNFWSSSWCYYELAVGLYSGDHGLNHGGVSFIMYPNNKLCGSCIYIDPVKKILMLLHQKRPDFELDLRSPKGTDFFGFTRRYYKSSNDMFPKDEAVKDLAWLIEQSLPLFKNIQQA